jgi:hypothetical protein
MAYFCVKTHTPRTVLKRRFEPKPPRIPTHEEIARLAYSYWESRRWQPGFAEADWLRAERELKQRFASIPISGPMSI